LPFTRSMSFSSWSHSRATHEAFLHNPPVGGPAVRGLPRVLTLQSSGGPCPAGCPKFAGIHRLLICLRSATGCTSGRIIPSTTCSRYTLYRLVTRRRPGIMAKARGDACPLADGRRPLKSTGFGPIPFHPEELGYLLSRRFFFVRTRPWRRNPRSKEVFLDERFSPPLGDQIALGHCSRDSGSADGACRIRSGHHRCRWKFWRRQTRMLSQTANGAATVAFSTDRLPWSPA
jgi:hypothetical protein